jgi:hypothetical protein
VYLRRASICGGVILGGEGPLGLDVLDKDGDLIDTYTLSNAAFKYLRRCLKFKRERPGDAA